MFYVLFVENSNKRTIFARSFSRPAESESSFGFPQLDNFFHSDHILLQNNYCVVFYRSELKNFLKQSYDIFTRAIINILLTRYLFITEHKF